MTSMHPPAPATNPLRADLFGKRTPAFVLTTLLSLVGSACSQDDPIEVDAGRVKPTEVDASMLEELTTADLIYPVVPGSHWVYRHSGGSQPWDEEADLVEEDVDGASALVLKDTPGPNGTRNESVLTVDGTVVYRAKKSQFVGDALLATVEYDPGFIRGDQAWTLRAVGFTETPIYHRREWDKDGILQRDADRAHIFTVESLDDTVTVPAGEFENCLRVHRVRDRGLGSDLGDGDDKRFWYCAGIGKVREENDSDGSTEELVSCEIPGGACP